MLSNLEINGWKKFRGQPKLVEAAGRVQFGCHRNFFNAMHVVLLPINYVACQLWGIAQSKLQKIILIILTLTQAKLQNTGPLLKAYLSEVARRPVNQFQDQSVKWLAARQLMSRYIIEIAYWLVSRFLCLTTMRNFWPTKSHNNQTTLMFLHSPRL